MNRKALVTISSIAILLNLGAAAFGQVQGTPNAQKITPMKKVIEVGFANLWYPDSNSLGVQVATGALTPAFNVRIWVQYKGRTSRRFYEKRIPPATDPTSLLDTEFKGLENLVGAEIGIFIDSKNEIPEKDEKNCVRITAARDWNVGLPCTTFGKEK